MPSTRPNQRRSSGTGSSGSDSHVIWALLLLALVLLVLFIGAGLAYVVWRHPSLATPLGVACTAVTLLVTVALALTRR